MYLAFPRKEASNLSQSYANAKLSLTREDTRVVTSVAEKVILTVSELVCVRRLPTGKSLFSLAPSLISVVLPELPP